MGNCLAFAVSKMMLATTPVIMPAVSPNPDGVVKVIHAAEGRLQEFRRPVVAGQVVAKNPNCFLCSSERMDVDVPAPSVGDDEVLQTDQVYFLMPSATSQALLSFTDLCELAIKAGVALKHKQAADGNIQMQAEVGTEKEGSGIAAPPVQSMKDGV
ncbi:hypothetical protein ACLOJK_040518 [Asimina triloba]